MKQIEYELDFTEQAQFDIDDLKKHPSLNTHKYDEITGPNGEEVFESYAQNNTPGAYRIFWIYGPGKNIITILRITPHP